MPNPASLSVENAKRAAMQAVAASMPAGIYFGTVSALSPLKITVENKLVLEESQLVLTSLVQDFTLHMAVDHRTAETGGGSGDAAFASHSHGYGGTKAFGVQLGLKMGEKVLLIRIQGGQQFVVLDRVR